MIADDFAGIANRLRALKGGRMCDCSAQAGHAHNCAIFRCTGCGSLCDSAPAEGPAYCPSCCPDHDYRYEKMDRCHRCITCGASCPDDYFDGG